ncbi:MAG: signal recognition particle receptor subunit alpha, partial [Aeromicrobium sp.]
MTTSSLILFIAIAVAVVVLGVGIAFVLGRNKAELPPTDVLDHITEETIKHPEHPEPHLEGEPAAVGVIERPEAPQGRIVRLRSRLARSQGSLGRGLLAILGRDKLDDDAWEEIEDTLLGADVGVAPTQELVKNLRTRLRVE